MSDILRLLVPVELVCVLIDGLELGLTDVFHTLGDKTIGDLTGRLTA
jgi:hypothetical protein